MIYNLWIMWFNSSSPAAATGTAVLGTLVLALCIASPTAGHEPVDESIQALTLAIERAAENPSLYLHRAELHRLHGNREAAATDLASAAELGADAARLGLCRAALDLDLGKPAAALARLDAVIDEQPGSDEPYRLRARARAILGDGDGAIADLNRALALSPSPRPETYLERARLQAEGGGDAVAGLDEGINRLGPLVSLVLAAAELETECGHHDSALNYLELLETRYGRGPSVLVRRAQILEQAGRRLESLSCYTEALVLVEELPPSRRASPVTVELERKLRQALIADNGIQAGELQR
jgi:tetratricopeptide (TPR) repeat protein